MIYFSYLVTNNSSRYSFVCNFIQTCVYVCTKTFVKTTHAFGIKIIMEYFVQDFEV